MELLALIVTAVWLGFFHTLLGPDHYLPFVALRQARHWSLRRTLAVTIACGVGHVGSSVAIGVGGIWAGYELGLLERLEATRGDWAGRLLFAFGLLYLAYGIWAAIRNQRHRHHHLHEDGTEHEHTHGHRHEHAHVHGDTRAVTPWVLFIIFVLGPCEPLIPLLILPAIEIGPSGVALVAATFSVATIGTMVGATIALGKGVSVLPLERAERFVHALAGGAIALTGAGMVFFGL